ncbi:MAG: TonB-dependent receptor [Armatimonadota bacterium]
MSTRKIITAVVLVSLVLGTAAFCVAEDEPTIDVDVVFSATKTEQSPDELTTTMSVFDEQDIEESEANNLYDILEDAPSIDIVRSGSPGGQLSIFGRGGESNHTLFLVDGVKANLPTVGQADIADFSLDQVGRVEAVSGPMGTLYGSEAMTGVIQVFTAPGWQIDNSVEAGYGTDGQGRLSFSYGKGDGDTGFGFSGSFDQHDGFYRANDDYERRTFVGRWDTECAGGDLTWTGRYFDTEKGMPAQPHLAFDPNDRLDKDGIISGLTWNRYGADTHQRFQLSYFNTSTHDNNPANPGAVGSSDQTTDIDASVKGAEFQQDWYRGTQTYTLGAEYREREADFHYVAPGWGMDDRYDESNDNKAAFAQMQADWGGWDVVTGVRWEDNEQFGSDTNYRAGVSRFSETANLRWWANYGTAFRAPTLTELYYPNTGNTDLKPEENTGWEIGLGTAPDQPTQVALTYFENDFDNLIDFDATAWRTVNAGKATTRGYELTIDGPVGTSLSHELSVRRLSYWTGSGDPLLRRPKWMLAEKLRYSSGRTSAVVNLRYVGKRMDNDFQPPFQPDEWGGYLVVDVAASRQISDSGTELWLQADNVLDHDYEAVAGYPAPDFNLIAGVRTPL